MSQEITRAEIDLQAVELLPERAALSGWGPSWVNIGATNTALALNADTFHSYAAAAANQQILVR